MEYPSCQHIEQYLVPGKRCHLVGIGGVSMRPLGLVLRRMGMEISGSDMNASVSTDELIAKGIQVSIGHRAENIEGADCLIRTAAAHNDNPEIAAARARGIPIFERAQAWGPARSGREKTDEVSGPRSLFLQGRAAVQRVSDHCPDDERGPSKRTSTA